MRIGRLNEPKASAERGRAFMYTLGLVGLAMALGLVWVGFNSPNSIPGRGYYTVEAEFANADNVANHSQVRINGKLVGQVLKPRAEDGLAVVDLQIDPAEGPLKSDTRIEVRPRSAVGVRYVDIIMGTRGRDLKEGERIPAAQTEATVPLDEVFSTFDADTRVRTQKFLRELGKGAAGRGEDINETLATSSRFFNDGEDVLEAIADKKGAMRELIRGGATIAGATEPVREDIRTGFRPQAQALKAFADARDGLSETLEIAPTTLTSVRSGLVQTDPFVRELAGFARNVRPVLSAAPTSLAQTSALLRESRPGLRAADETLRLAETATGPTLDLLDSVRPILPNLDGLFEPGAPIIKSLGAYSCDFKKMGDLWANMQSMGNGDAGVLRFNVVSPGQDALYGSTTRTPTANPKPAPGCKAGTELKGGTP